MKTECRNCKTLEWAAKNSEYCNVCCENYIAVVQRTLAEQTNPIQKRADAILGEFGTNWRI